MNGKGVVIIGTGLAGYSVAREFRKADAETALTLITTDDGAYYSKPQLSTSIASKKLPDSIPLKNVMAMKTELKAQIHVHTRIVSGDPDKRELTMQDGSLLGYENLVIAVGSKPRNSAIAMPDDAPFFTVNNLEDYRRFYQALQPGKRIVIIGSGLIGCEFANDLALAGYSVTVVGNGSSPLLGLLSERLGMALASALEKVGVRWQFNSRVNSLTHGDHGWKADLAAHGQIEADIFLSCIGIDPDLSLANTMGIAAAKGIKVDAFLQSSQAGIYAIGDCAEIEGRLRSFILPITHSAKALGLTLAGKPTRVAFPPMPVVVKTPSYPLCILPPEPGINGLWNESADEDGLRALFTDAGNRILGFALGGHCTKERQGLLKQMAA